MCRGLWSCVWSPLLSNWLGVASFWLEFLSTHLCPIIFRLCICTLDVPSVGVRLLCSISSLCQSRASAPQPPANTYLRRTPHRRLLNYVLSQPAPNVTPESFEPRAPPVYSLPVPNATRLIEPFQPQFHANNLGLHFPFSLYVSIHHSKFIFPFSLGVCFGVLKLLKNSQKQAN